MTLASFDLSTKAILITGASSGMGEETALQMAAAGAAVCLVARDQGRLQRVAGEIRSRGGKAHSIVRDLTERTAAHDVVRESVREMGTIDILVNVAGIFEPGPFEVTTTESLKRQYETNLLAPFTLTQAALPHLSARSNGVVIFVSSMAAVAGFSEVAAYSATKGAVEALGRSLAVELAPRGVRVNVVAPGEIDTPMNEHYYRDHPEVVEEMSAFTPAGRLGVAADVAPVIVFLASDAARFVFGTSIPVDGGVLAR
jgi:NAD(P)-dependent dehydrogenase (short-subunit alcohol dehydrogenase family)